MYKHKWCDIWCDICHMVWLVTWWFLYMQQSWGQFDQPNMGDLTIMVQPVGVAQPRCRSRWLVNASSPPSPSINQNWLERSQVDGGAGFDCGFLCKKWIKMDKGFTTMVNQWDLMGIQWFLKEKPFQLLGRLVLNGLLLNVWKSSFLRALAFPQT